MQILRHNVAARLLRDDAAQLKAPVLVLSLTGARAPVSQHDRRPHLPS